MSDTTSNRVLVFGGSGRTGGLLIEYALSRGIEVVALVREPAKIAARSGLHLVTGTPENIEDVRRSIEGCGAVISVLSAARGADSLFARAATSPRFMTVSVNNAITVMKECGLRRIEVLTGIGLGDSFLSSPLWLRWYLKIFLRASYADHEEQEKALRNSGLDWTSVRAAMLTNHESKKDILLSYHNVPKPALSISRLNVAKFMIDSLGQEELFGAAPVLSER